MRNADADADDVTAQMDGNCSLAQAGVGKNEYYPCIPSTQDCGVAIVSNLDEAGRNPL